MLFHAYYQSVKHHITKFNVSRVPAAVILMYHRISDVTVTPNWLAVSPNQFARQLEHIRQEYCPIRLLDLIAHVRSGSIPHRAVAVTFDDGYYDNLTGALPLLEAARIPATVFVTAGFIDSPREFWWDELARFTLEAQNTPCSLELVIQGHNYIWEMASAKQRQAAYSELKELVKPLTSAAIERVLNELATWSGLERALRPAYRTMTSLELRQMAHSEFIDIGAHTVTHPILPTQSLDAQYDEIVDSRRRLEAIINRPVRTFAYPNGDFTKETTKIVEQAGFVGACTTKTGRVERNQDPFTLRRFPVNDWDVGTFEDNLAAYFRVSS